MDQEVHDLELAKLTKAYGEVQAVDGVSLAVRHGEFLSLLGPSGCGKTTTLRLIAGFEQPDSGEIYIQGVRMANTPPYERTVNTVFQSYALFPHLTVFENIAFGLRMKGLSNRESRVHVERMLEIVELRGYERRLPSQLSGGEQQRVALARALVNRPTVLLLDEPLGALDLKVRQRMQIELKRIHQEVGITFIYVTHDQEEALVMSDRVAVMNRGRAEQIDTAYYVYERPRTSFVANFVGESNRFFGKIVEVGQVVKVDCGGGLVLLSRDKSMPGLAPGQQVETVVRPEKISMLAEGSQLEAGWNAVAGVIIDTVFRGGNIRYVLRLRDGEKIVVDQRNSASQVGSDLLRQQVHVVATWSSESTLLFLR